MSPPSDVVSYRPLQRGGLIAGALVFVSMLVLPAPESLSPEAWRTAAVGVLMAVWWVSEAVAIPITALLPLALFPALGILSPSDAAAPYANELIFLFMGGFFLAEAMQRWGLHRRIALGIVAAVGTGPERLVLGFMLATAFLSMWISNTATAAMMLPIGIAVAALFAPAGGPDRGGTPLDPGAGTPDGASSLGQGAAAGPAAARGAIALGADDRPPGAPEPVTPGSNPFGVSLMLGIAYAASIGGVATLIGTPPNAVFAAAADELLGVQIGFLQWMAVGVPVAAVMLPLTWLMLVKLLHPPGPVRGDAAALLRDERASLGPRSRGETLVAIVFAATALAWIMREPKDFGTFAVPGLQTWMPQLADSTIAMAAALALFLLPVDLRRGTFVLEWPQARRIPWGVLILFGGGLSLARAMDRSGLATWIGGAVAGLGDVSPAVVVLVVASLFVFLTEVTSNTATATMAMPVMVGAAAGLALAPIPLMTAAALAASMAFMLPVATPPNAIVFGSDHLSIPIMARAGFLLNLLSIVVVTLAVTSLVPLVLSGLQ